jgi:hypothetical protein
VPHLSFPQFSGRWHESKSQELRCFADYRVILHAVVTRLVARNLQFKENVLPRYSNNLAAMDIVRNELEISQQTVKSGFSAHVTYLHFARVAVYDNIVIIGSKPTVTKLLPL